MLNVKADIRLGVVSELPVRPPLWRILHDVELGSVRNVTPTNGAPEVHRLEPYHMTRFFEPWQWLSFNMNQPGMTPQKWTALHNWTTVITNEQGYNKPGDPRRNYILGTNLTAEHPKVASLLFGGNVITGRVEGEWLEVETLDARLSPPTLGYILTHRWLYSIGTNVRKDGRVGKLPQGEGRDVLLPIYASKPVRFPMNKLVRLADNAPIPSPYL